MLILGKHITFLGSGYFLKFVGVNYADESVTGLHLDWVRGGGVRGGGLVVVVVCVCLMSSTLLV